MTLCMQHLEILLQIGQHFVSVEQRDYLILTQLILLSILLDAERKEIWGIERSGFFNGREKWAKGFENQRV